VSRKGGQPLLKAASLYEPSKIHWLPLGEGYRAVIQMPLPMLRPTRHPRTGTYRLRLAIPRHLRDTTKRLYGRRAELIENLLTKDPKAAKALAPATQARLREMLERAERAASEVPAEPSARELAALVPRVIDCVANF
jgi:hypothetical protein